MRRLEPADLQAFLEANAIPGEILHLDAPTPTVEAAARAVGTRPEAIVKSILFLVRDEPVLAVSCGTARVDRRAVAAVYGVGRKRARLAEPETVLQISGFEIGAMPPFGHRRPLPTLLDHRVLEHATVYAGGGGENALLRLTPQDILRVTGARVTDLLAPPAPG